MVLSELLLAMAGFQFFFVLSGVSLAFVIIEAWGLPWWVLSKPDRPASKPLLIQFFLISLFGIKSCDKTVLSFFPLRSFTTFLLNGYFHVLLMSWEIDYAFRKYFMEASCFLQLRPHFVHKTTGYGICWQLGRLWISFTLHLQFNHRSCLSIELWTS